ncbi:hypothetical protein D3C87_578030 [compost metagenome]
MGSFLAHVLLHPGRVVGAVGRAQVLDPGVECPGRFCVLSHFAPGIGEARAQSRMALAKLIEAGEQCCMVETAAQVVGGQHVVMRAFLFDPVDQPHLLLAARQARACGARQRFDRG